MDEMAFPDLFATLDYRAWLREVYQARKSRDAFFSYRFMASRTGVDAGWIAKVLSSQEHLSQRSIEPFAKLFGLGKRETEFFEALVALAKARGTSERAEAFERAMALKSPARTTLGERQLAYYGRWWHAAIRSLVDLLGRGASAEKVAALLRPKVTVPQVRQSLEMLEEVGLLRKSRTGWQIVDAFVASPPEGAKAAVRAYQAETMDLAKAALESHSPETRDISSLTLSFRHADISVVRERVAALRDSLIQLSGETPDPDTVFQVNLQIFPVTVPVEARR